MTTNDSDLAARAGTGDREAFRVLLERHYDRIYRVAYRFTANVADAEDIAQDICVSLPRKLKSFRGSARFTTWLYTVCLNACRDHRRKRLSMAALGETYVEVRTLTDAGDADTRGRIGWVYEALDAIGEPFRETALLVLSEDLTHAEAGDILGAKEATVSWRMHEVRRKLKALAGETHDG